MRLHGVPVVGIDIAGAEKGYPAHDHAEAYDLAHSVFLNKTVHAGEEYGPDEIFSAVTGEYKYNHCLLVRCSQAVYRTELRADRVGHGFNLFRSDMLQMPDPDTYVASLVRYLADRRIAIEVCLSSNIQVCVYCSTDGRAYSCRPTPSLASRLITILQKECSSTESGGYGIDPFLQI